MGQALNLVVLFCAILAACGVLEKHSETDVSPTSESTALEARRGAWLSLYDQTKNQETGWPSATDCDGTLWAGLAAAAGAGVSLELAEHAPGVIHRRPTTPCYPNDLDGDGQPDSRSTVSRDMFTGYLWGMWARRDTDAVRRLVDYGEAHDFVMGEPKDRTYEVELGQNLTGLACRMLGALGGGDRTCAGKQALYLPVAKDYEAHIQVLAILLQGEVSGIALTDIDGLMLSRLEEAVADYPGDALFQAALGVYTGDLTEALTLLNDDAYACPSYTRGSAANCLVHKMFAASIVLKHVKE